MTYELINIMLTVLGLIIALGGGISGFVAVYIIWKKSKSKLKVIISKSNYFIEKNNLIVNVILNLRNEKNIPQSITDIVASIRFDQRKKSKGVPKGFSVSPIKPQHFPLEMSASTSQSINLKFVFPGVEINSIDRCGEAKLLGIYEHTPILVSDERDFNNKWEKLPLLLRLDLHINGESFLNTITGSYKGDKDKVLSGTFNSLDVGKIQHEFMGGWEL